MKKIIGIILLPLLYVRYGFILIIPLACYYNDDFWGVMLVGWFIYAGVFSFIMGNFDIMEKWTSFMIEVLKIKYDVIGEWANIISHSHSTWAHPIVLINGRTYRLSFAISGGNTYECAGSLQRRVIMIYLFDK